MTFWTCVRNFFEIVRLPTSENIRDSERNFNADHWQADLNAKAQDAAEPVIKI